MLTIIIILGAVGLGLFLFEKILPIETDLTRYASYFIIGVAILMFLVYMLQKNNMI